MHSGIRHLFFENKLPRYQSIIVSEFKLSSSILEQWSFKSEKQECFVWSHTKGIMLKKRLKEVLKAVNKDYFSVKNIN